MVWSRPAATRLLLVPIQSKPGFPSQAVLGSEGAREMPAKAYFATHLGNTAAINSYLARVKGLLWMPGICSVEAVDGWNDLRMTVHTPQGVSLPVEQVRPNE